MNKYESENETRITDDQMSEKTWSQKDICKGGLDEYFKLSVLFKFDSILYTTLQIQSLWWGRPSKE